MADTRSAASLAARLREAPVLPRRIKPARVIADELMPHWDAAPLQVLEWAGLHDEPVSALLAGVAAHSPFLAQIMRRDPAALGSCLVATPELQLTHWLEEARREVMAADEASVVMEALRRLKRRAALLIALADCGGVWGVEQATAAISDTADTAVRSVTDWWLMQAAGRGKFTPLDPANPGEGSGLIVLALGKHGARELNYSSDIDLVLFYDPEIAAARGIDEPQSFFVRFARDLSRLLQERTADGYVFRVDLRLRPDPASTQAAVSTHAAYAYYESVGQNWERAAFIKARPIAGDTGRGQSFLAELSPFIWRKYFDFAAIADIHAMKRQIQAVKGHEAITVAGHDVKLGRGGIREIEFFVQTQQLVFGGRRPALRGARTLEMLATLVAEGWITDEARADLQRCYRELRRIEHRLQMRHDEQTQRLPVDANDLEAFARFAGFPTRAAFDAHFTAIARTVERHYAMLFEDGPSLASEAGTLSFTGADIDPETVATLTRLGFREPETAVEVVRGWHFGRRPAVTSARAREALTELTPALLVAFGRSGDPDQALNALDAAFARMPAAVELMTILNSHERLLGLFASILGSAPRLARIVGANPHVLDGVIDPAFTNPAVDAKSLEARIAGVVGQPTSHEETLDRLRDAVRQENFLIGARLLSGIYAPEMAGRAYAAVADSAVRIALSAARRDLVAAHGDIAGAEISILGLGRLGSRDLTATSDLDLVIIYDAPDLEARSDGARPLDVVTWAQRLGQRLVAALTAPTRRGTLYDVDLRLRPSGGKGPVAVRLSSFAEYQQGEAEMWEHMALTKVRAVAGNPGLCARVMEAARSALARPRDAARVRREVKAMRALIAEAKGDRDVWDLKLAVGGLTDIDFIAETIQLVRGQARPAVLGADLATVLGEGVATDMLTSGERDMLLVAHALMNGLTHWIRLVLDAPFDPCSTPAPVCRLIARAGDAPDVKVLAAALADMRAGVRAVFDRVVG